MPSRWLVASALIRPMVKLPVRSLRRRHSRPYPCRLPSRSEPARCRLLWDFAHAPSRGEALTPLAPGRASAARCGRTTRSRVRVRPFRCHACDGRGTRGWGGADLRVRGGAPLVEPKTRTAEALLGGVVAGLHTRTPRSNPPAPLLPVCANGRRPAPVFRRAPRGSSPFTDQLLPTIHAIVAFSPSLLRVALFTAASRGDPWIYHLATVRTERHRRISTPMIHVGTKTVRHDPLGRALPSPLSTSSTSDPLSRSRVTLAPTDLCPIGAVRTP